MEKKIKLLLIDDEIDITDIVKEIIEDRMPNVEVGVANFSRDAAKMMPEYDVILSDVNMPEKSILDKAIETWHPLKPIARITGHYEKLSETDLIVKKPFRTKDVLDMVEKLISLIKATEPVAAEAPSFDADQASILKSYHILDSLPEKEFDNLTFIAGALFDTDIATIGFLDKNRHWFKSNTFTSDIKEVSLEYSFCYQNEDHSKTLVIEDTLNDSRFKNSPYVLESPFIRSYVGVPLIAKDKTIGYLCVFDKKAKKINDTQLKSLQALADQAMSNLEKRKQHIEENRSNAWKKALLNNSSYSMISINMKGEIVTFNSAAEKLLGYTQNEVMGKHPDIFHVESEVNAAIFEMSQKYKTAITIKNVFTYPTSIGDSVEREWTFIRKDGSTVPVSLNISQIKEEEGDEIIGYIGIAKNLSDQKEKEKIIISQQNVLLENAKMSSLGEMASGIAHEINNPLAIISGRCSQLISLIERDKFEKESATAILNKMILTVERASKIIKGLKNFSRNSDGEPFSTQLVSSIVEDSLGLCEEKFKNHGIKLEIKVDPTLKVSSQGVKISQVVINLLNNSFDAVKKEDQKWIRIDAIPFKDKAIIKITDSGPKIPTHVAQKIMTPFFTTKEVGKGTGIGLSISKGICEQHNGRLYLDQNETNTTFVVELPKEQ